MRLVYNICSPREVAVHLTNLHVRWYLIGDMHIQKTRHEDAPAAKGIKGWEGDGGEETWIIR
jgi:hypothetical protein